MSYEEWKETEDGRAVMGIMETHLAPVSRGIVDKVLAAVYLSGRLWAIKERVAAQKGNGGIGCSNTAARGIDKKQDRG